MGRGAFDSTESVVLVPKAHTLTEALMRIMVRDLNKIGSSAVSHYLYIPMYVEQRGILDISLLPECLEQCYKEMKHASAADSVKARAKLRRNLGIPVAEKHYR
jgi:hypothetical protein